MAKLGRPIRGKERVMRRSVTMTPSAWLIVQRRAQEEDRSVSEALQRIVEDWAA